MHHILIFIQIAGLGNISKNNLIKWILYKFYVLIFLMFLLYKTVILTNALHLSIESKVVRLVTFFSYYTTYAGCFLIYLEVFLNSKNFRKTFKLFSKIDVILSSKFQIIIDYKKLKRLNCLIVSLAVLTIFVVFATRIQAVAWSDIIVVNSMFCMMICTTATFLTLIGNFFYRLTLLNKIIKSKDMSANDIEFLTQIFIYISEIVDEMNRYFNLKFLYISCKLGNRDGYDQLVKILFFF